MKKSNKIFLPSAICHLRHIIFAGFLLSSLVAASTTLTGIYGCAGLSTNGVTSDGGGSDETEESGGAVEFPSTIDIPAGTTTPGTEDPNAMPQISLPAPSLQSDRVVAFASDATSTVALDASSGTVDTVTYPTTDYVVGVSKDSTVVTNYVSRNTMYAAIPMWLRDVIPLSSKTGSMLFATKNKNGSQDDKNDGFSLISKAHAQDTTTICDATGLTCCPINSDGSFTCYIPETTNSDTLYIYLTNSDGSSISAPYTETPNTNLLWFAKAPSDLKEINSTLYAVTDGIGVQMDLTGTDPVVNGDYNDSYESFTTHGSTMDYDSGNMVVGDMLDLPTADGGGVYIQDASSGTVTDTGDVFTVPDATGYKITKYVNGYLMCGVEEDTEDSTISRDAYLYWALDNIVEHDYYFTTPYTNAIKFIDYNNSDSLDLSSNPLTHAKTIAFDINSNGWAFVLYQDEAGYYRVRISNGTTMFGGTRPMRISSTTTHDFKAIGFINESTTLNRMMVVDSANDAVYVIRGNVTTQAFNGGLSSTNTITVGDNPVAMTFNADRSRAYVLNQTDASISVITVPTSAGTMPTVTSTLLLSDYTPGKTLTFTPSSLYYKDGVLYVGAEGIKGAVVVDVTAY